MGFGFRKENDQLCGLIKEPKWQGLKVRCRLRFLKEDHFRVLQSYFALQCHLTTEDSKETNSDSIR